MSPLAETVLQRLDAARQKWWFFSLLSTVVLAVGLSFGIFLVFMLTDSMLRLPQPMLLSLFAAWLLVTLGLMFAVGRRLLRGQRSLEAAARRVECEFPELGSQLINIVQLSEDQNNADRAFCEAAVNRAATELAETRFDRAARQESRWQRFRHCMQTPRDLVESAAVLGLLVTAAVGCQAWIPNWSSAATRLLAPWEFVPSVGAVKILTVAPGSTDVLIGNSVPITAEIDNPNGQPHRATLFVTPQNEPESSLAMAADASHRVYTFTVSSVLKPFRYRLEIGDSQTKAYAVGVCEKPVVESVEATYRYPAYLGRKAQTITQKSLDLEAPQYTVAELRLAASTPIAQGYLEADGERRVGRVEADGRHLVVSLPLLKDGSYAVRLADEAGHGDPEPRLNRITVVPDRPPTAELLKPEPQSSVAPGAAVPVTIHATDDHGLQQLRLEMKVKPAEPEEQAADAKPLADDTAATVLQQWTDFDGPSIAEATRQYRLRLKPDMVKPGQTVLLRAVATDRRAISDGGLDLRPQEGASGWHTIKIVAPETQAAAVIQQLESLRADLWKILEKQISARVAAAGVPKKEPLAERTHAAAALRTQQIEIQKAASDLVASIGPSERQERLTIKRALHGLTVGPMLQAVTQCDALIRLTSSDKFAQPTAQLIAAQDQIIAVLRKLLDVSRRAGAEAMAESKKRPGGNLPDDVKHKFEELRDKLAKFLQQQKKVIEATKDLAKTPVEDFTKEQQEALRAMAAVEDDWSKFMKDTHSDLSKLPEQDFANASMLKEHVEIQTELKMAEDALLKKTADIAVPLEQVAYERAEELKTNFEKWLPDTPDREKWSQEESPTDKDKEAPMAELPGELEDIVGDLMEKEEDLFDEVEDVTSSAADSADKGAGWDAMDGPISVMSAKGVTGNRLPNTSEIGGRSGEGRQGKSSGEFVGDEAVGKGGRNTPSQLTPDAVVKGQIKDHSKQAAGGATGGGKESGKGGEGLEGPASRFPGPRDAQRLAAKQASLRNEAQGLDLRMQVSNFHHTDLKQMIERMGQVERDLKAGRYQNALRQRRVLLDRLGDVKKYVEGRFAVRQDTTSNLPSDVQKKILGSMQDPSPAGWEELNRQYFERLSGEGETSATAAKPPAK